MAEPSSIPRMRAARIYDTLDVRIEHVTRQPIPADHVAIAPQFCGICGSDLHVYFVPEMTEYFKTPHPLTGISLPAALGHEFAGVVKELGSGCTGKFKIGDKVAVMPTIVDGTCYSCTLGNTNTCSQIGFVGYSTETAGMCDWATVPEELLFRLPEGVDCDVGALIEPLAVAWHATSLYEAWTPFTTAIILGAGPVGCAIFLCLKARGIRTIIVSEPAEAKRKFIAELGANFVHNPVKSPLDQAIRAKLNIQHVDVVFDCAGAPTTLNTAVTCLRARGTIVNVAIQILPVKLMMYPMIMKEIVLKCSLAYTNEDFQAVVDAIGAGMLVPKPLITKRIRLEDVVEQGLEALHQPGSVECKILVDMSL